MYNSITVSIIIPAFNQGKFLNETLESVYNQSFSNWECIIVNDGSTDNTEVIALHWSSKDPRFAYFKKENAGLSSARNFGIKKAKGDWIQLLDSDDLLEYNKLQYQLEFGLKTNAEIIISGYRYFDNLAGKSDLKLQGRNALLPEVHILEEDSNHEIIELLKIKNPFVISAPLYKKEVFNKVGLFDVNFKSLEDWDFHLRCALAKIKFHHVGYSSYSRTLIRLHDNSMMTNRFEMDESARYFSQKHELGGFLKSPGINKKRKLMNKIKWLIINLIPPIVLHCIKVAQQMFLNSKQ